ncbi:hypothetical protein EYF80_056975 [Liparis tanakae]|uniref:Uncharacterized protein n=1 Tax=Liparis tanakae TaxID=230148 RepID=A0A4Z2EVP3_9TELE|nr:hypothetical protein EYF80_056975 [Liparis tanakae]
MSGSLLIGPRENSSSRLTICVWVFFFSASPCFLLITSSSFFSSQVSMVSGHEETVSPDVLRGLQTRGHHRSWLNLHFSPLVHWPCLKKAHSTDLGSTPGGTRGTGPLALFLVQELVLVQWLVLVQELVLVQWLVLVQELVLVRTFGYFLRGDDRLEELVEFIQLLLLLRLLAGRMSCPTNNNNNNDNS